jgi:hypothetical protein
MYHFVTYLLNFTLHPAVKVNSIWRGNCWGSSVWILANLTTDHIFCARCPVFLEYADMEYMSVSYICQKRYCLYCICFPLILLAVFGYRNMCIKYLSSASLFCILCRFLNLQWHDIPPCDTDCDNEWKTVVILRLPTEHNFASCRTYLQQPTSQHLLGNTRVEAVWSNWRWQSYR